MTTTLEPTSMIEEMVAIELGDLVAAAELLTRVDRKYVVPIADLDLLLGAVAATARVLEIDGRRRLGYRSVYFDTADLAGYHSAVHRRRRRFKIRTRSYLDTDLHLLEVKTRGPRGTTIKRRLPYDGTGEALSGADRAAVHRALAELSIRVVDPDDLRSTLVTRYDRTTLVLPATGSRVTLDAAVRWTAPDGRSLTLADDLVVVETKSAGRPSEVDRLLWSLGRRPLSLSKYGAGLAALTPELTANRWRPVLRRHVPTYPVRTLPVRNPS